MRSEALKKFSEPIYVISFEEVFWGALLVAITMTIHVFGMLLEIRINYSLKSRLAKKTSNKFQSNNLNPKTGKSPCLKSKSADLLKPIFSYMRQAVCIAMVV